MDKDDRWLKKETDHIFSETEEMIVDFLTSKAQAKKTAAIFPAPIYLKVLFGVSWTLVFIGVMSILTTSSVEFIIPFFVLGGLGLWICGYLRKKNLIKSINDENNHEIVKSLFEPSINKPIVPPHKASSPLKAIEDFIGLPYTRDLIRSDNPEAFLISRILSECHLSRKEANTLIIEARTEAEKHGWEKVPNNFGDFIITKYTSRLPISINIMDRALSQGAKVDDIRSYWNIPGWQRYALQLIERLYRIAAFEELKASGTKEADIVRQLNTTRPVYGDAKYWAIGFSDADKPITWELCDRIYQYLNSLSDLDKSDLCHQLRNNYSSFNAYAREMIQRNLI